MAKMGLKASLTANVIVLGVTSLLTDVSSEMIFPLLPFFMVNVLGIPYLLVGLIEGAAEGSSSLVMTISGWLSDRMGMRKVYALIGYILSTLSKPLFAFANSTPQILAIRISDRLGKGVRTPPRDALLADSVDENLRGRAFGFHRSMDTTGAILGPLLALALFPIIWYRGVFLTSLFPGVASVVLLWALLKERSVARTTPVSISFISSLKSFRREFKVFIFIQALFAIGNFSYAFFLLRSTDLGVPQILAPMLYLVFNTFYAILALPMGAVMDRIGRRRVMLFGYGIFALTSAGFAWASSIPEAFILFAVYGLFRAAYETSYRALVPELVPPNLKATAYGVLNTVVGLMALPGGIIAGALWQVYGGVAPFILSLLVSIASVVIFLIFLGLRR